MTKYILLLVTAAYSLTAGAQEKETKTKKSCSCAFSSINQVGWLEGAKGSSFQLQTINGFRYKSWFAGIGAGLEYYYVRGVPVFLDIRKDILNKPNTPFVYADGGMHFGWERDKDKERLGMHGDISNGPFFDAGLGLKFAINKNALLLSIGYSHKYVKETYEFLNCGIINCTTSSSTYRYKLNRLSLKAGWQL